MNIQTKTLNRVTQSFILRAAAVALPLLLTVIFAISSWAYGPARDTYTIEKPADRITFNSITNNPNYGDERNFVLVKDAANTSAGGWSDEITVQDGKEYLVRMYVHNNAAENLNLVSKNTRVMANVPNVSSKRHQIDGFITSDNATPSRVWDSVVLKGDKDFVVKFVGGSAVYRNNINAGAGFSLSDGIVTSAGVQVGYRSMNGDVPGCFEYSGIATFRVKVTTQKEANFDLNKKVRHAGTNDWKDRVTAKPGDKLEYRIGYNNSGEVVQNNVILRDTPPQGITFSKGSSELQNATNPDGKAIGNDSLITSNGVNIGNYTPRSNAFVYYSAVVSKDDLKCGTNKLINTVTASTDGGRKSDTAEVVVEIECKPTECKPGIPEGDKRCESKPCEPKDGEVRDENGNCVPAELPTTGPAQIIAGILGVTLVSLGVAYWIRSRNEYKRALAGFTDDFTDMPTEKLLEAKTSEEKGPRASNLHK